MEQAVANTSSFRRKEFEDAASAVIERAIDEHFDKEWLREALNRILPAHYDDIVEERSLEKKCGYPLCAQILGKVTEQKFHICLRSNTVVDLSERKKFCSQKCLERSNYLKDQIPTSPLWMRTREESKPIKFKEEELDTPDAKSDQENPSTKQHDKEAKPRPNRAPKKTSAQPGKSVDVVFGRLSEWWTDKSIAFVKGLPVKDASLPESEVELVKAFYKGSLDVGKEEVSMNMPQSGARTAREGIVNRGLEQGISGMKEMTGVAWLEVADKMKILVQTFNLTADNVILRPNEWMLASLVIIEILSISSEPTKLLLQRLMVEGGSKSEKDRLATFINGLMQQT